MKTLFSLLAFSMMISTSLFAFDDHEYYLMDDCKDPISKSLAGYVTHQIVSPSLKDIPGAVSVAVGECATSWALRITGKVSGRGIPLADTCGARIKFSSREYAVQYAQYATLLGSSQYDTTYWVNGNKFKAWVSVCGEDIVE